jgi:hypothetical protein
MSLISSIKKTLTDKSFVKNSDFCNENVSTYDYKMSSQDWFRVSVFYDSKFISVDITHITNSDKFRIAERYEIQNINEFIFLLSRTSRSPLFQI